jgi:hypothetical protein
MEPRHALSHCLNPTRDLLSRDSGVRATPPELRSDDVRKARHDMPIPDEQARGMDLHEHLAIAGHRLVNVVELEHIRGISVTVLHDRPQRSP